MAFKEPGARRRFYLKRGLERSARGGGSDLSFLMDLERKPLAVDPREIFAEIPFVIVGGVATRAYMPERQTKDIDCLVMERHYDQALVRLKDLGYGSRRQLFFPNASLGLYGNVLAKADVEIDLISSPQEWVSEAIGTAGSDQTGMPVIPLAYLVLMKLDAARGIDQGDLTRMLGRLDAGDLEDVIAVVSRHNGDPEVANDVRQYAALGRLEWEDRS